MKLGESDEGHVDQIQFIKSSQRRDKQKKAEKTALTRFVYFLSLLTCLIREYL